MSTTAETVAPQQMITLTDGKSKSMELNISPEDKSKALQLFGENATLTVVNHPTK